MSLFPVPPGTAKLQVSKFEHFRNTYTNIEFLWISTLTTRYFRHLEVQECLVCTSFKGSWRLLRMFTMYTLVEYLEFING